VCVRGPARRRAGESPAGRRRRSRGRRSGSGSRRSAPARRGCVCARACLRRSPRSARVTRWRGDPAAPGAGGNRLSRRGRFSLSLPREEDGGKKKACWCAQELETSFTYVDENVNLEHARSPPTPAGGQDAPLQQHSCRELPPEWAHDSPSLVSEEDDAASEAAAGKSVDYGFISAILFLVSGILLVIISYVVPRDVTVDPNTVAAREMERLENESARIGAHLDRCVIAGLCLLTLGGVVLSSLLMMSMWKGELYRRSRFASSKESAKLYGSFNFRMKSGANDNMLELSLVEEDVLAIDN
uniref:Transmembrane protein 74 n=1 Tax=Junco hyemalis TaxID=40217 RepID=A0A8C5IF33_JUNHY